MLKKLSITLCVACALALAACGESTTTNNSNAGNTNANRAASTTTTTSTAPNSNAAADAATKATGEKIGIAECDDFLEKYEACVSGKVPEAMRAQYKTTMEQWRNSWRGIAANPQTRATLTQVCKTSIEQARASLKSYGCEL